jgi:predicted nucleotidyltransferase
MVDITEIRKFASQIAKEFHPDRVVLFGSYAYGKPGVDSDVDLLVILEHRSKNWELAAQIRDRINPQFPVDLIVRSPGEVQHRLSLGDPFLTEITRNGAVLYEAHHTGMDR